jgi:ABC-2 type transport system permease protein
MDRLLTVMRKEVYHIRRDPRTLGLIILLPAMLLILLGYGISGERTSIPMAVVDYSKSDASRNYIEHFTSSNDFRLAYDALSEDEIFSLIDKDKVDVGLVIPEDFGRNQDTNQSTTVQFYVDGSSDPTDVQTIQLKLNAISQVVSQNILVKQISVSPLAANLQNPVNALVKTLYNPNGDTRLFMIPGLIPIILQMQALLLTTLAIVREREQGTMEQLIVTPVKSWELMLGKIIPYMLVSVINLVAMLILSRLLFGVTIAGNPWELFGLSLIFIIGSLGMGVLISNISQSQLQAVYLAVFLILIPAIILSGLMFPRDNMPAITYWYGELLPVTQYLEITRGIIVRGIPAIQLWSSSILPLLVLSVGYFTASVFAFRKRM